MTHEDCGSFIKRKKRKRERKKRKKRKPSFRDNSTTRQNLIRFVVNKEKRKIHSLFEANSNRRKREKAKRKEKTEKRESETKR